MESLFYVVVGQVPSWCVLALGVFLCVQRWRQQPGRMTVVGAALGLMIAARFASYFFGAMMEALTGAGFGGSAALMVSVLVGIPHTVALALLVWAIFGRFDDRRNRVFLMDDDVDDAAGLR